MSDDDEPMVSPFAIWNGWAAMLNRFADELCDCTPQGEQGHCAAGPAFHKKGYRYRRLAEGE